MSKHPPPEMFSSEASAEALRTAGFKLTPQRRAILELFAGERGHWTAPAAFAALSGTRGASLSQATVYNTLETLSELGILSRFTRADGVTMFDRNTKPHHHAVCSECGVVVDVEPPPSTLERVQRSLCSCFAADRFSVESTDIWLTGTCGRCRR